MADNYNAELDKQIVAYLLKELTAKEEALFLETIEKDFGKKQYFENFEKVWNLLDVKRKVDSINIDEEREHLEQRLREKNLNITAAYEEDNQIYRPAKTGKVGIIKAFKRIAVAASVVAAVFAAYYLFNSKQDNNQNTVVTVKPNISTPLAFTITQKNDSIGEKKLVLEDGTIVMLWQHSQVSYRNHFLADRRDISLIGKASFKVAKNPNRPFTVQSGAIKTTALGTEFLVTNFEKEQTITVRLTEGKVVVKSADSIIKMLKKPVYLLPGQELVYNKQNVIAQIRNFRKSQSADISLTANKPNSEIPSIPEQNDGTWYMFNNQSLPDVFDQLEGMFSVKIQYNKEALKKIYFIGKFDKTDSLVSILKTIATVNKLTITKANDTYIIQ